MISDEAPNGTWSRPRERALSNKCPCRNIDVTLSRFYLQPWPLSVNQVIGQIQLPEDGLQLHWPLTPPANSSPALWDNAISFLPLPLGFHHLESIHSPMFLQTYCARGARWNYLHNLSCYYFILAFPTTLELQIKDKDQVSHSQIVPWR